MLFFFLSFTQTYHRRGVVLYCVVLCYYVGFTLTNHKLKGGGGNTKKEQLFFCKFKHNYDHTSNSVHSTHFQFASDEIVTGYT